MKKQYRANGRKVARKRYSKIGEAYLRIRITKNLIRRLHRLRREMGFAPVKWMENII